MIHAVIFDLDNTLLDFMKMKEYAVKAAITGMKEAGLAVEKEASYDKIIEMYNDRGWENQQIFNEFLIDSIGVVDYKILAAGIVSYRRAREANLQVYPNVNSTLMALVKMGLKLAVVSDAPSREAWMRLYYLNLHHMFDVVLTFDDTKARKPSPIPFTLALEKLECSPEGTLMVGDWPERDVEGAKNLGMKTIFARYGDTFDTTHSGADWDVDDIHQIVDIVKEINAA